MTPKVPGRRPQGNVDLWGRVLPVIQQVIGDAPVIGDFIEIITGREDGTMGDIGSIFNSIFRGIAGVSSRVSALEGKITTGAEFFDLFNDHGNGGAIGNGWTQGGTGMALGVSDKAAQISRGGPINTQPGRQWAKAPAVASGNDFTVSMITHPLPIADNAETALIARANADFTEGVCARMVRGKSWISKFVRSGVNWSYVDLAPMASKSCTEASTVEFKGQESVLQLVINGDVVISASDDTHAIDAAHRSNGFYCTTTVQAFGTFAQYSPGLASYSLKSAVTLDSVVTTVTTIATAKVAPVAAAVTAGSTGAAMPVDANTEVYAATKTVSDNASAAVKQSSNTAIVVQQQQQNQNAGTGGVNKLLTFGSGALNSTDWTTTDGVLFADSGQMVMNPNVANGHYMARANYTFATDDQAVVAQLGTEATNDVYTYLVLRANSAGTQGVACRVSANYVAIGTVNFTGSGGDPQFSTVAAVNRGQGSGDAVEFRAIGNNYVALVNGSAAVTFSGALGSVGSSWRGASVIKQRAQPLFVAYSFNLRSFGMYDFGVAGNAVTSRTAARISRTSTATVGVGLGNGGVQVMPSNFFSTIDFAQGMTVTDITTGSIRIDTSDWYEITATFQTRYTGNSDYWGQSWWSLYVNGAAVTNAIPCGVPLKRSLFAGDVVQVGFANQMSSVFQYRAAGNQATDTAYGATAASNLNGIGGGGGGHFFQIVKD